MKKKLYRSEKDRRLCGVCGGVAEYFNIDSTIVRLIFVCLCFAWGTGVLVYIAAALIIPDESAVEMVIKDKPKTKKTTKKGE